MSIEKLVFNHYVDLVCTVL